MTTLPPLLELTRDLYRQLILDLARSGGGARESGAFLLGTLAPERRVREYLLYDVVAPEMALALEYVALTGMHMAIVWEKCQRDGLQVVADIHTHPGPPLQSSSDRAYPIVSIAGHIALIAPYFALRNPSPRDLGVHRFVGRGRWQSYFGTEAQALVELSESSI
jgi:proteasome lid subunit RPN8/RPN11